MAVNVKISLNKLMTRCWRRSVKMGQKGHRLSCSVDVIHEKLSSCLIDSHTDFSQLFKSAVIWFINSMHNRNSITSKNNVFFCDGIFAYNQYFSLEMHRKCFIHFFFFDLHMRKTKTKQKIQHELYIIRIA